MLLVSGSDPSFRVAREKAHFSGLKMSPTAWKNVAPPPQWRRPHHHRESVFVQHVQIRVHDRPEYIHRYSLFLRHPLLADGCFDRQEEFSKIRPQGAHSGTRRSSPSGFLTE
jgi:hypothetical protein